MKVTLFGATGKTGAYLIGEGLKRGFDITVFARSGTSFENSQVRVVRGELTDIGILREAIRGSDTVLSALGPTSLKHPKYVADYEGHRGHRHSDEARACDAPHRHFYRYGRRRRRRV